MTNTKEKKENAIIAYSFYTSGTGAKVRWPTLEQGWSMTKIVLAVTFSMSIFLGVLDFFFGWLLGKVVTGQVLFIILGVVVAVALIGAVYLVGQGEEVWRSLLPEEYSDEEEIEEPVFEETEDALGPLPTLELSPDAIFERLGLDGVAAPSDESEGEVEETAEVLSCHLNSKISSKRSACFRTPFADEGQRQGADRRTRLVHRTAIRAMSNKARHNLEQRIESMGMQDWIFQVVVPTVEEIELKDGKRRTAERCLYPGYPDGADETV